MPPKRGREESKSPEPNQKRMREEEMGIPEPRRPVNPQGLRTTPAFPRAYDQERMLRLISPIKDNSMERSISREPSKESSPKQIYENPPKPMNKN